MIWKIRDGKNISPIQDNSFIRQIHFIEVTSGYDYLFFIKEDGIKKALKKFGHASAFLSEISMVKHNCITKEKYEEMYKTSEESEEREDLSVGEDLEYFIGQIRKGKFLVGEDYNPSFMLCLLDAEERKKLEEKDEDFMKTFFDAEADVPEAEWKESESNMKFANFSCTRRTYSITE